MITSYIEQIQSIFTSLIKYYKANTASNITLYGSQIDIHILSELQGYFKKPFSSDLVEMLNWMGIMPIYKAPFIPYAPGAKNFVVWANNYKHYLIEFNGKDKMDYPCINIMNGEYIGEGDNLYLFKVYVDVDGLYFDNAENVFVRFGKSRPSYSYMFAENEIIQKAVLGTSIGDFLSNYLSFLKNIPLKKKTYRIIDFLLQDPTKLFRYVKKFNWDNGQDEMEYIVKSAKCDTATALLIYWLSSPYSYSEETIKTTELIPFIIEKNIQNGFYQTSSNHFDPINFEGTDFITEYQQEKNKKRLIPEFILNMKV